jgi:8-oxo-dGTP diphosphatase
MRAPAVEVAASIVLAKDGRVLMAERTPGQISPGFWELPGGKIDEGESAEHAAVRELEEEIGIRALELRPWMSYEYPFRLRRIRLHFFKVHRWEGTAHGREGQKLAWIDPAAPTVAPILPSVERVLGSLALPSIYAVCQSVDLGGVAAMLDRIAAGVRYGIRLYQLREPDMAPDQRVALGRRVNAIVAPAGARVLLVGSALEARRAGLAGVHSTAQELRRLRGRPPVKLWVCSCHDDGDLSRATELGADAVVVSPVLETAAHPGSALGWNGVERLSARASLPVYAQGGLDGALLASAQRAGAIGIATARWHATIAAPASAPPRQRVSP